MCDMILGTQDKHWEDYGKTGGWAYAQWPHVILALLEHLRERLKQLGRLNLAQILDGSVSKCRAAALGAKYKEINTVLGRWLIHDIVNVIPASRDSEDGEAAPVRRRGRRCRQAHQRVRAPVTVGRVPVINRPMAMPSGVRAATRHPPVWPGVHLLEIVVLQGFPRCVHGLLHRGQALALCRIALAVGAAGE